MNAFLDMYFNFLFLIKWHSTEDIEDIDQLIEEDGDVFNELLKKYKLSYLLQQCIKLIIIKIRD